MTRERRTMEERIVTYEPDNSLKSGYLSIFAEIFRELARNRWLTYQLFKRNFLALYKQSFIGVFWAVILPLISVGTFIILNRSGIFSLGHMKVPYAIYAVLGLAFWQIFATGILASANSLVQAGPMITKINFSKKSLVIASAGQALISFAVQIILVLVLFVLYRFVPDVRILLIPLMIVPIVLLTLGLGLILSLLNGVFRDIGNALSMVITFFMFLTPVLYAEPSAGVLAVITRYNPLYYLVAAPRELVLTGAVVHWKGFLASSIFSLAVFTACILAFHLTETRVAERI